MTEHISPQNLLLKARRAFPIGKKDWHKRCLAALMIGCSVFALAPSQAHNHTATNSTSGSAISSVTSLKNAFSGGVDKMEEDLAQTISFIPSSPYDAFPFVDLGVVDSFQGEGKDQYMLRVGQVLHQFTSSTGHEGCGIVMKGVDETNPKWRVRLITNRSQVACVKMLFDEEGFVFTDETIHSHPQPLGGRLFANAQDQRIVNFECGKALLIDDEDFSPGDLKGGAGYLVARGQLLYQRDGVKRTVGSLQDNLIVEGLKDLPNPTGRMSAPLSDTMVASQVKVQGPHLKVDHFRAWNTKDSGGLPEISCRSLRQQNRK